MKQVAAKYRETEERKKERGSQEHHRKTTSSLSAFPIFKPEGEKIIGRSSLSNLSRLFFPFPFLMLLNTSYQLVPPSLDQNHFIVALCRNAENHTGKERKKKNVYVCKKCCMYLYNTVRFERNIHTYIPTLAAVYVRDLRCLVRKIYFTVDLS